MFITEILNRNVLSVPFKVVPKTGGRFLSDKCIRLRNTAVLNFMKKGPDTIVKAFRKEKIILQNNIIECEKVFGDE